jgi:hypothetical protein
MFQSLQCLLVLAFVALNRHVNAGIAKIVSHADLSHRDHSQTRIFEFKSNDLRNLFTQRFRDSFRPMHNNSEQ